VAREFLTTATLVDEIRSIGVDELAIGPDAYDPGDRMAIPDGDLGPWIERARDHGADGELLDRMTGGNTGAVAVLDRGEGPAIGLRVDIDGLFIEESTAPDHAPADEGFRSEIDGTMHACGHDVHVTWGSRSSKRSPRATSPGDWSCSSSRPRRPAAAVIRWPRARTRTTSTTYWQFTSA